MPLRLTFVLALLAGITARGFGDDRPLPEMGIKVAGRVVDADSGEPVQDFQVIVGSPYNDIHTTWQGHLVNDHTNGKFAWRVERAWRRTRLRIQAKGYRPAISPMLRQGAGSLSMTFRLRKDDGMAGVVKDSDGNVVPGAQIALTTQTFETIVENGQLRFANGQRLGAKIVESDLEGRFSIPAESDPFLIVAADLKTGFAILESSKLGNGSKKNLVIQLQPWCRVEGTTVDANGKPQVHANYEFSTGWQPQPEWPVLNHRNSAKTDKSGKFVCTHVAAGSHYLQRWFVNGRGAMSFDTSYSLDAIAGKTMNLNIGKQRRTVTGQLVDVDEKLPGDFEWPNVTASFVSKKNKQRKSSAKILRDGSFRADNLPPGNYKILFSAKPDCAEAEWSVSQVNSVVVPIVDKDDAKTLHDLGDIAIMAFLNRDEE